jgi:hypothetical protein
MADKKISALPAASTPLAGTEVLPIVQGGITEQVSVANLTAGRAVNALSATTTAGLRNTSAGSDTASTPDGLFLTDGANKNAIVQLGASGGVSTFIFESGGAGWRRVTGLLTNGNNVVDVGNLVIGTAGKGIDFSANTHAAGMTSELLNDYEEGTWTPSLFDSAGNALTIGTAVGRYTRIGNAVTITCSVSWTSIGSAGASPLILAGLPFAAANVANLNQSATIGFMSGIDTVLGTKQITANLPLNTSYFTFRQTNDNAAPTDLAANSCSATGEIRLSATYIV